jgi:hypothetical protein
MGEQVRPPGPDQGSDGPGVVGDLDVQEPDAAGQGSQAGRGRDGLGIPGSPQPQPPTGADELAGGQPPKPPAERVRGGDHQGVELALGVGGGLDRHHRTEGSLTVIPQTTTAPNQTGLTRNAAQPDLARPNWTV